MTCEEKTLLYGKEVSCQLRKKHKGMHEYSMKGQWGNLEQYKYTTEKEAKKE